MTFVCRDNAKSKVQSPKSLVCLAAQQPKFRPKSQVCLDAGHADLSLDIGQ